MRAFTAVIERRPDSGLLVGHVPGFPGAHSQGQTPEELRSDSPGRRSWDYRPVPQSRDISPILLRKIARDIGMTAEELQANGD